MSLIRTLILLDEGPNLVTSFALHYSLTLDSALGFGLQHTDRRWGAAQPPGRGAVVSVWPQP